MLKLKLNEILYYYKRQEQESRKLAMSLPDI